MHELLRFVGAIFVITATVALLGGLYDLRRAKQPITGRGVAKALAISAAIPLGLLAFGVASAAIPILFIIAVPIGIVGAIIGLIRNRRTRVAK